MGKEEDSKDHVFAANQQHKHKSLVETPPNNIPVISFAGIDGPERQQICQQIAEACETWGFFHLIDHGIDQSLIQRIKDVSLEFFHAPEEEKTKIRRRTPQDDGWTQSNDIGNDMLDSNNLPEGKDTPETLLLNYYPILRSDRVPQQPASYKSTLEEYIRELRFLGNKLFGILSEMLGLAPEALVTALTAGSTNDCIRIAMRSNFYGLKENGEALPGVCHPLSDPGGLTILLADDVPGLEVRNDGRWLKVDPIAGGFVVNVGDMLQVCSNGRYNSVEHRGLPCNQRERLSLALIQAPQLDAQVGPVPSLLDENHPPLYKPSVFGAYLASFVKAGLGHGKASLDRIRV